MTAPSVALDVLNLALLQLNHGSLTSLQDPNNPAGTSGTLLYDQCRRSLIRNFNWNFARTRGYADLLPTETPAFDYSYYYTLPANLVKLIWVGKDYTRSNPIRYDHEGDRILVDAISTGASATTPATRIEILYSRDVTDATKWDPLFMDAIVLEMAVRLCVPVTGDLDKVKMLKAMQREMLAEAVVINHQERPVVVTEVDYIAEARNIGFDTPQVRVDPSYWNG